jgi:hypothetical protein
MTDYKQSQNSYNTDFKSLLSSLCQPTVGALSKGEILPLFGKEGLGEIF